MHRKLGCFGMGRWGLSFAERDIKTRLASSKSLPLFGSIAGCTEDSCGGSCSEFGWSGWLSCRSCWWCGDTIVVHGGNVAMFVAVVVVVVAAVVFVVVVVVVVVVVAVVAVAVVVVVVVVIVVAVVAVAVVVVVVVVVVVGCGSVLLLGWVFLRAIQIDSWPCDPCIHRDGFEVFEVSPLLISEVGSLPTRGNLGIILTPIKERNALCMV